MSRDLDDLRRATEATPGATQRVRDGVDHAVPRPSTVREALGRIPVPGPAAEARVQAAVAARLAAPTPSPWLRPAALATGGVLVAGLAAASIGAGAWLSGPSEPPPPDVVEHTSGAWEADPSGAPVVIHTREALVHGVTDADTVRRDLRGTHISGPAAARVTCLGAFAERSAEAVSCAPVSSAGLLAVAEDVRDQGAPPAEVLRWLDRASLMRADEAVRAEIRAARIVALYDAGNHTEARILARDHVTSARAADTEDARLLEVARIGAGLALAESDCAEAMPFLQVLASHAEDAAQALKRCEERVDAP